MVGRFVREIGRLMKRAAIMLFLVMVVITGAALMADHYLNTTCISGFGTYNNACIDGH